MFSSIIKFILTITAFAPTLLSLWIANILQDFENIYFYFDISSFEIFINGFKNFARVNYLLLIFILIAIICIIIMEKAIKHLTVNSIVLKSIKPADQNLYALLLSIMLPFGKIFITDDKDYIYIIGFIFIAILASMINKSVYHFNLIVKFFLGYRYYEIQTKDEITYVMLSKKKLINSKEVNSYLQLTDYLLINAT